MIKINCVNKSYKDNKVLSDFNYCFNDKGLYLIVGKSGVGKTTLLNIISGKDKLYEGNVYRDKDIFYLRIDDLIGAFTVRENIEFIKDLNDGYKLDSDMYGLDALLDKKVDTLSLGEKKRLVFYLSVISNKKIVLLDEPLSNLDYSNKEKLIKKIEKESKQKLFIVVSHEISGFKDYVLLDLENNIYNYVNVSFDECKYKKQKRKVNIKKWGNVLFKKSFISLLIFIISISTITFSFKDFKNELLEFKQSFLDSYTEGNLLYKPNDLKLTYESFYNGVVVNLAGEIQYYGSSIYSYKMYDDKVYLDKYYFDNAFLFSNVYMGEGIKEDEVVISMNFYDFCNKNDISGCNKEIIKEYLIGKNLKYIAERTYEYKIREIVEGDNLVYVNDISKFKSMLVNEYDEYLENYYIAISDNELPLFYEKINHVQELLKYDFYEQFNEDNIHYFLVTKASHEYFSYKEIQENKFISCSSIISCSAFDYLNLKALYYINDLNVTNLIKFDVLDININGDEIIISSALSKYLGKKKDDIVVFKYYIHDAFYSKYYKIKEIINEEELLVYGDYEYLYSLASDLSGETDRIEYVIGELGFYQNTELLYSEIIKETKTMIFSFLDVVDYSLYAIYMVMIILIFMIEIKRGKKFYSFYRLLDDYEIVNRDKANYLIYTIYFMMLFVILVVDLYFSIIYLSALFLFMYINKIKIQVSLD